MHSRNDIGALLSEHGLAPRRDLGQNFVVDANIVRKIARLADVGPGDHVVEIGAGLGSLTMALAETGATITAIEVDHGVAGVLRTVVADLPNVTVVEDDALRIDWNSAAGRCATLGARRQPAVQRRHAAGVRSARLRSRGRANAGDGAARGRRTVVRCRRAPRRTAPSA